MSDPADLGVCEAAEALAGRALSSRELTEACLARIRERDGTHSHEGDPDSINAWVRVYEEDALASAERADERLAAGDAPVLCGVPIGLKDLYAVARQAADRVEPCAGRDPGARLRRLGAALRRRDGAARPPAHARVRLRRDDRPGRQPVGARALGGRLQRRLRRGARLEAGARGDRHRHRRLAAHPLVRVRDVDDQADAWARLAPRDRPARPDLRPSRARWPARSRDCEPLLAAFAGVAAPTERRPLRRYARLPPDRRPRPRRRRRVRAGARGAAGRARRAAASDRPPRRPDRVLRPRAHRDARLPPPLRRPARRLPPVDPRPARARRARGR